MKKISDKDKKDWQAFIDSKDSIPDKDRIPYKKNFSTIEKIIDLHGFTLEDANKEIEKFIFKCFKGGVNKINIITGKGSRSKNKNDPYQSKDLSILKFSVPNYIKENKGLMQKILRIDLTAVNDPSKGSFDVYLKKKND